MQGQISSEINFLTLQEIFELNELNIRVSELIILARADLMELKSSEIFCLSYTWSIKFFSLGGALKNIV